MYSLYHFTEILARHSSFLVPCSGRLLFLHSERTNSCTVYHHLLQMVHLQIQCLYLPLSSSSTDEVPLHQLPHLDHTLEPM